MDLDGTSGNLVGLYCTYSLFGERKREEWKYEKSKNKKIIYDSFLD